MSPAEPPRASKAAPTTPLDALVARQMAPGDHQDPSGDVLGSMFLRFGGRNRRKTEIIDIAEVHIPFLLMRFFILFLLRLLLRTHIIIILLLLMFLLLLFLLLFLLLLIHMFLLFLCLYFSYY